MGLLLRKRVEHFAESAVTVKQEGYEYIEITGYVEGGTRFVQIMPVKWQEGDSITLELAICRAFRVECTSFSRLAQHMGWMDADWTVAYFGTIQY
jgi:tRNA isopentenyl-2-thiomethyl-A-37 hydroxylase MiaE